MAGHTTRLYLFGISRSSRLYFWLGIGLVFLLAACLHVLFADAFPLSSDEGIHLMWVRLIETGYVPYSQVYITYPPLYPLFLVWSWNLWPTLTGLRWFTLAYTFPSVIIAALIARRVAGNVAGIATAILLSLAPQFVNDSRAILGELPSVTWSLVAVWSALVYRDTGRRLLLVASALAVAFSLLTKVLSPFVVVLVLFIILNRYFGDSFPLRLRSQWQSHHRRLVFDLLCWLCAFLIPFVLAFALVDLGSLIDQVIGQRLSARVAYAEDNTYWASRVERMGLFLGDNLWTIPLAALGLMVTFVQKMRYRFTLVAWLVLALLMLLIHDPVRYKHFTILLPLLAIWAGVAVGQVWRDLLRFRGSSFSSRAAAPIWTVCATLLGLVLLLAYCLRLPDIVQGWQAGLEKAGPPAAERIALDFISKVTTPDDCLITDDMPIAYWSNRLVPPELAEVSTNRLRAGDLTLDELIGISMRYDCQVVAAVSNRITKYLPAYEEWVRRNYLGRFHYGEDDLYVAKAATTPDPAYPLQAQFGRVARLLGYTLDGQNVVPGARVPLILYWESLTAPDIDYTIFVHARDAANVVQFTADHRPYEGTAPTTRWKPGAVVRDVVWVTLPGDLPPGEYGLWVGMYRVDTMERLPLMGDMGGENALQLGRIKVVPGS